MKTLLCVKASVLALAVASPSWAQDQDPWIEVITVSGQAVDADTQDIVVEHTPLLGADAAGLLSRLPGGALVKNGALTGQVQYRGLFGPRVPVQVNGQSFASGGPNLMDPPLSYAPMPLLERLEVTRGVAPVSKGPGLSAGVNAVLKSVDFTDAAEFSLSGDVTSSYRSNKDSWSVGGIAGLANHHHRAGLSYSYESGGDLKTPVADLKGVDHQRLSYGLEYGYQLSADTQVGVSVRRQEVDDTGTPSLGMDIRYIDTTISQADLKTRLDVWRFVASLGHARVDHGMNNYDQRPAPMAMMWRENRTSAESWTGTLNAERDWAEGVIRFGLDREQAEHSATIINPNNAGFLVTPFADVEIARTGVFGEWEGPVQNWQLYVGARIDSHEADGGEPLIGPALPMGPRMIKMAYDQADRSWDDVTFDGVVRGLYRVNDMLDLRFSVHRKSRVASYVERFAWLPIAASGGLADGNTYVGGLDLDPEVSTGFELGFDWQDSRAYLRPSVHYAQVDNYIQGVAFDETPGQVNSPVEMVSMMNGDMTPLRFANVDAKLYGFDADFGYRLTEAWRVDGTASYVLGERDDISDDLYRIAPANLRLGVTYEAALWSASLETLAVAEQDKVSVTNSEVETPGYVIFNAMGDWQVHDRVRLSAGIENLFDHRYREHLAGYNRNASLGIPVGERLPGAGRGVWLRLNAGF